jgi:hypothetical protein
VEEGEVRASSDAWPTEGVTGLFRAGPERDPPDPRSICRFLAREGSDGTLEPSPDGVDAANRCTALGEPVPQSARQQQLVCLVATHANCPRYLRGLQLTAAPALPPAREPVSRAVIGASLVLAAALAASFGFLAVRGSFALPTPNPTSDLVAVVTSPPPSNPGILVTASSPGSSPSPSPTSPATQSPAPTPTSTPTPAATPTLAPPTPTPNPTSDRFALLTKCPSTPDCWIYVIRAGDNLQSIAHYFGVSYNRMMAMNPSLRVPIHAGDQLRMPTPTR